MTPNRSLILTHKIQAMMRQDLLQFFEPIFPVEIVKLFTSKQREKKKRDRVYNEENTLLTMIITAVQADKSLQNSVSIFKEVFKRSTEVAISQEQKRLDDLKQQAQVHRRVGRPSHYKAKVPPSKLKEISWNTAAYSKARSRIDLALIDAVFRATTSTGKASGSRPWHGRIAYNTDGTYFQMQDAIQIPEKYRAQKGPNEELQGYPQGLLQVLVQQGSGYITGYKIAGRGGSELTAAVELTDKLPAGGLLLADALYNAYAFMCRLVDHNIDIIVPDKKHRQYTVVRSLAVGDEIVQYMQPRDSIPYTVDQVLPKTLTLRRIEYPDVMSPEKRHVLLTSVLDEGISAFEIVQKYATRWDVEVTIREIKTLMDMNIARAKSEEMVFKEIGVALCAYNMIRRILEKSVDQTDFPPQEDIFQELFAPYQNTLVDRKGRVYSHWAPGRPPRDIEGIRQTSNSH